MGALSILLIAVGAILAFAVNVVVDEVELVTIGVIMMVVGGLGLLTALVTGSGFRSFRSERHVSPDGRHVVEETQQQPL